MTHQVLIGVLLIVLTTIVHLVATKISLLIISKSNKKGGSTNDFRKFVMLDLIIIVIIITTVFEAFIWGGFYYCVEAIKGFEESIYFSIVTYTTLGYGDITLDTSYRILASLEAATGIIIFGWSTAIVMAAIQNLYFVKPERNYE